MRRVFVAVLLLLASVVPASAQGTLQPPPGWARSSDGRNLLFTSPADGAGRKVLYMVRAAEPVSGSAEAWFAQIVARIVGGAAILQRSGQQREQTIVKEALIVRRADGIEIRIDAMAYATPQGHQMMAVVFPAAIGTGDARVNQAYDHFAGLWRSGYRLAATGTPAVTPPGKPSAKPGPPSPVPPRATQSPATSPGKNCRREPVWGQRISPFCKPSGICSDRVIKEYRTVCG